MIAEGDAETDEQGAIGREPTLVEFEKEEEGKLKGEGANLLSSSLSSLPPTRPLPGFAMVLPVLLLLPLLALAHPTPHLDGSDCSVKRALPTRWYHEPGHPVEQLFKRQDGDNPTDGNSYPVVGSPGWAAAYPDMIPDATHLPQQWVDALNAAVSAGKIPNIPVAANNNGNPVYPPGVDPNSQAVCSGMARCRNPDDIWDAPDGTLALSFDDGPSMVSAHPSPSVGWSISVDVGSCTALFPKRT